MQIQSSTFNLRSIMNEIPRSVGRIFIWGMAAMLNILMGPNRKYCDKQVLGAFKVCLHITIILVVDDCGLFCFNIFLNDMEGKCVLMTTTSTYLLDYNTKCSWEQWRWLQFNFVLYFVCGYYVALGEKFKAKAWVINFVGGNYS